MHVPFCISQRAALSLGIILTAATLSAQTPGPGTSPNGATDADAAWKAVEKASRPPMPPPEWQQSRPTPEQIQKFREEQGKLAGEAADKAHEFYTKYPENAHAADARKKEFEMLRIAVYLGNSDKEEALDKVMEVRVKDPKLPDNEKAQMRAQMLQRAVMKKHSEGEEAMLAEQEKGARAIIKDYPKEDTGYDLLLDVATEAEASKGLKLAKEIHEQAPSDELKSRAQGLMNRLEAVGKPLNIKFKAVDGRDVDVSQLKGKVVLIDFWATWCGPCVGEVPNVVSAYDKLHPKGFEIVGISFDADQSALENFVSEKKMKWPQYFDGKRWQNKIGEQFGINSIPTMWLVDKKGNLRDVQARGALEEKVEKLLAE